jgi:N-acetylmuramoyl-L-alanine amidase
VTSRNITHIVVHCSAEPHGRKTRAKDIDVWHRQRGFIRLGYHYVIPVDGTVETGRPLSMAGAHVEGHNKTTIGICLVGGLDPKTRKPSAAFAPVQFAALERLIRELREKFPKADVLGHRDFPGVAKDCPSFDVRPWAMARGIHPKGAQ